MPIQKWFSDLRAPQKLEGNFSSENRIIKSWLPTINSITDFIIQPLSAIRSLPSYYKNLIKISSTLLLVVMLSIFNMSYVIGQTEIRDLNPDFLDIDQNIVNQQNDFIYNSDNVVKKSQKSIGNKEIVNAPVLKGGISELRAIVGKSQIVRFDEPVTRISITKPELVDMIFLSPQEVIMNGKEGGETTVIIWGEGKEPVFFNLFVENSNLNFINEVRKVTPNEDLEIDFIDEGSDTGLKVVLKGKLSSSIIKGKIDDLAGAYGYTIVDLTETLEPQIMLEVKVVEMSKSEGKARGYEFKQGLFDYLDLAEGEGFANTSINLLVDDTSYSEPWFRDVAWEALTSDGGLMAGDVLVKIDDFKKQMTGTTFENGSLNNWKVLPDKNLAYKLNAAESEGLIKILSEPRVMVINGNDANFTSGSEVPVPAGVDELGNIQYEYATVGTTINIKPTILEKSERIVLDISTSISEIDNAISSSAGPGFNTRNSKTKVEVADNHTTVITGLVRKSETKSVTKMPYLSNLPFIGKFFDNVTESTDETELMIFVTASIVKANIEEGRL